MTYLTVEELATELRTTPETIYYWRSIGTAPVGFRVGRRVLFARADVDAWVASARAVDAGSGR